MNHYCNRCHKDPCGCPKDILSVTHPYNDFTTWMFSLGGLTTSVDFRPLVQYGQTDTRIVTDTAKRLLRYMAENHTDVITADELGRVLHLGDLGDVDMTEVRDNSLLFYSKDPNCGSGCQGKDDGWKGWSALDAESQGSSFYYPMGFDSTGKPKTVSTPNHPEVTQLLGWKRDDGVGYITISKGTAQTGVTGTVHMDLTTGELFVVPD